MSHPGRRTLLLSPIILMLFGVDLCAQQPSDWEMGAGTAQQLNFYETRMLNKNVVAAAGPAHYAFLARYTSDYVLVSDDTASTIRQVRSDAYPTLHYDLAYPSTNRLYVIADSVAWIDTRWVPVQGMIFRSLDGGTQWDTVTVPPGVTLNRIAMVDDLHGIATQVSATATSLLRTTDGWDTWQEVPVPDGIGLIRNIAAPEADLYILNGTFRTTDGGATWAKGSVPPPAEIVKIQFLDKNLGWGAGGVPNGNGDQERDLIARTTDGGMTWTTLLDKEIALPFGPFGLRTIAFADSLHGYAGGKAAKLLMTDDGGLTWTSQNLPQGIAGQFDLMFLAHPANGLAVGAGNGAILRSRTSSTSSVPAATPSTARLHPNPASSTLFVEGVEPGTPVTLVGLDGREVQRETLQGDTPSGARIDLSGVQPGVYLLRTGTGGQARSQLVVVH